MSLLGLGVNVLRAVADAAERLEHGVQHGPWCETSQNWMPESPDGRIVPIRIADEVIAKMFSDDGWEANTKAVLLRNLGDDTYSMFFVAADEVDHLSNRTVQRMMMSALDLSQALDSSNCELSEEAIIALAEFKKAARQRLSA